MTIVITHDLSQIEAGVFVYMPKDGMVVEQRFQYDFEGDGELGSSVKALIVNDAAQCLSIAASPNISGGIGVRLSFEDQIQWSPVVDLSP
jgi:hypothetical protein